MMFSENRISQDEVGADTGHKIRGDKSAVDL